MIGEMPEHAAARWPRRTGRRIRFFRNVFLRLPREALARLSTMIGVLIVYCLMAAVFFLAMLAMVLPLLWRAVA